MVCLSPNEKVTKGVTCHAKCIFRYFYSNHIWHLCRNESEGHR